MATRKTRVGPITGALVRRFIGNPDETDLTSARSRSTAGILEGYISLVVNTLLFAVKLALGLMTGSIALVADAVHTVGDSATSLVVIFASYSARRPPDEKHPYGHGRVEGIAAVVVAMLLAAASFELAKTSVERVLHPSAVDASWGAIVIVALTAVIKEWLSSFALALGRLSGNQAIEADAWHHRSDVIATALVVVGMVASRYGIVSLDGWMGIVVCLVLGKVSYDIGRSAVDGLIGAAPTDEEIRAVDEQARSVEGVLGVHDIVIHNYGPNRFVSLHVQTSDALTAPALHSIADAVERRLGVGHGHVCVHVDPLSVDHPEYAKVLEAVRAIMEGDEHVASFHDLRVAGEAGDLTVELDVNLDPSCPESPEQAEVRLADRIREATGAASVSVEIEPSFSYQV